MIPIGVEYKNKRSRKEEKNRFFFLQLQLGLKLMRSVFKKFTHQYIIIIIHNIQS